ncbi:MAG: transmembrane Fragile-X-F protein [Eubacteriales bacterium]|nr:transmembrane Fragile-X-F protein [Eubacteriales bacterium]
MDKEVKRGGMGFVSILTLIFIVLKLTGLIDWSWVLVLSPVWISGLFFAIVFAIILIGGRIKKGKW